MIKAILHVSLDEKFVAAANLVFSKAFPTVKNDFFLITSRDKKLKFGKLEENFHIILTEKKSLKLLYKLAPEYDLIVLHFLPDFSVKLVNNLRQKTNFMWMVWGTEIYGTSLYKEQVLGELSKKYFRKENLVIKIRKEIRRLAIEVIRFKELKFFPDKEKRKALKKIKLVGTIDEREFVSFVELKLLATNSKYVRFTYYPLEYIFSNELSTKLSGDNILIGNSATITNNHLEVFEKLRRINIEKRKVIVPLSYGSNKYADMIIKEGKHVFNANFSPLLEYMPLDQYQKIIGSCSIVIMNHYRQQGVGNILSMLWMGAKVFLSEKSILFSIFQDMGCAIFSVENDLDVNNKGCLSPLIRAKVEENREIIFNHFSLGIVAKKLRKDIFVAMEKTKK